MFNCISSATDFNLSSNFVSKNMLKSAFGSFNGGVEALARNFTRQRLVSGFVFSFELFLDS